MSARACAGRAPRGPVRIRWLAAALAWLLLQAPSGAQTPPADQFRLHWWGIGRGLPQGSINDLLQTSDGALWMATYGGLLRFDGLEFRTYDVDSLPGLRSNRITSIAPDGDDGLWFGTEIGELLHLRQERIVAAHMTQGGHGGIRALLRAGGGALWAMTDGGSVDRFENGAWSRVLTGDEEASFGGLCLRADGVVAVAAGMRVRLFDPSGAERESLDAPERVVCVAPALDGGLWVGLEPGLGFARDGRIQRYPTSPPIRLRVDTVRQAGADFVWLGTQAGPLRISTRDGTGPSISVNSPEAIPRGIDVRCLEVDREDNLWVGSGTSGLFRFQQQRITRIDPASRGERVSAVCSDGEGGAWIGNGCDGLGHFSAGNDMQDHVLTVELDAERACIQGLLRDRRGRIWAAVEDRLLRREPGADESFAPILGGRAFASRLGPLVETAAGDVWISTFDGMLARVDGDDRIVEEFDVPGGLLALAAVDDGTLWIGGQEQLHRLHDGRLESFGRAQGLPGGGVRALHAGARGDLWIATYGGGLAHHAGGVFRKVSRSEGLTDNLLTSVLEDGQGRLWILANLALMVVPREDVLAVMAGYTPRIEPVVLGPEAGMNEATFGAPAGFRDARDHLWFGTVAGVVHLDAAAFPFNRVAPRPWIDRMLVDGAEIPLSGAVEVPAGARRLEVVFTTFALSAPERVRFRYRLEGYDERWVDGGDQRRAAYSTLAPGNYAFHVLARNEHGVWSAEPRSLAFTVLPSWWQTLTFQVAAALAVAGALLGFHRLRLRAQDRRAQALLAATRERALAEERASRLREELSHVARVASAGELATSLAHEVNQPLAAIVANAQAGRRFLARGADGRADLDEILDDIAQQGQRAADVIRRLRAFLRKQPPAPRTLSINDVVQATMPLVRRELEDHRVRPVLDLADALAPVEADPVEMQQVLVNLVKNACEAMSDVPGERRVEIRTRAADGVVRIEVEDSGPGIPGELLERLFDPFVTSKPNGMGLGLAICRSMVEARGGTLSAGAAPGGGARFRVELPSTGAAGPGFDAGG